MPDNKQERKQPLERPFFRKTRAGMTFDEILFLGIVKNTGMNPKSDIRDYITEQRIQKCPISMDMFRRMGFFCVHVFCPQLQEYKLDGLAREI
jgi:hypothetical protein